MAYRKTETILVDEEERRRSILSTTLELIAKHGMEGATTAAIAQRGKFSEGVIYKYYADKTELIAAVIAQLLSDHLELLRGSDLTDGVRAWARQLSECRRLIPMLAFSPPYRESIKKELQRSLRAAGAESPTIACAVIYGAVFEIAGTLTPRDERPLLAALMRACGLRVRA